MVCIERININQLRYLVALIDTGTAQSAARQLSVSQPTISRAIGALEAELGVTLFERSGRRLVPTELATEIVAVARRVCADVGRIGELAHRRDTVTIAATPNTEALVTSAIVDASGIDAQPNRFVFVPASSRGETERLVVSGEADIGIIVTPPEARVRTRHLCDLELVLVAHRKMEFSDPIPTADLAQLRLVLPSSGTERRREIEAFFEQHQIAAHNVFESDNRTAWLSAAASGQAATLAFVIRKQFLNRGLQHYSLEPAIRTPMFAISVRQPPPAIRGVLDLLSDQAAPTGASANPANSLTD